MKMNYRYKLKPTTEQNATMIEWLNCCRNQYNYRLGERFRWWESTRTPIDSCPLNVTVVPIERIYQNIPEFRTQVRDGRKLGDDGLPITKKGDKHPNIVGGYVQWQSVQLADLKNTKKLFPRFKKLHSQVLQDVINRVETAFSNVELKVTLLKVYDSHLSSRRSKHRARGSSSNIGRQVRFESSRDC